MFYATERFWWEEKYDSLASCPRFRKSNSSTFKDLQTQIQGLSRTISVFKDFPGLEKLEKLFQDFQGPARALTITIMIIIFFVIIVVSYYGAGHFGVTVSARG